MLQSTISLQKKTTQKLTVKKPTNFALPHRFEGRDEEGQSEQTDIRKKHNENDVKMRVAVWSWLR